MKSPLSRVLALGILLIASLPALVTAAPHLVPTARSAPPLASTTALTPQFTTPGAAGVGDYFGGTTVGTSFQLPLVRTDTVGSTAYDTVIHAADSTTGPTTLSLTFYNANGSQNGSVVTHALTAWQSWDLDVGQQLNASFNGSATLTSSPTGIAVTVDVISATSGAKDNLDTYAGIPAGATSGFIPLAFQASGYITQFYVRNPNPAAAGVTLTFWQDGTNEGSTPSGTQSIPALGSAIMTIQTGNFQVGPVQVVSTLPVAVLAETSGNGFYTLATMAVPSTASTFYIPRFEYNTDAVNNLTSNLLILNTTPPPTGCGTTCPGNASYTATFYDSNGNQVATTSSTTNGVKPMRDWPLGSITALTDNQLPPFTANFVGSVVVTNKNNAPIVPVVTTLQGSFSNKNSITVTAGSNDTPVFGSLGGVWSYLPGLRKGVSGESTGLTLMNTQTTNQDYQITYWSNDGSTPLRTDTFSLKPNQAWYVSQAADSLSPGAVFSAQVQDISQGSSPPTLIQLYAGGYTPPAPPAVASPTPFATATPTPVPPTNTPIPGQTPHVLIPKVENLNDPSTSGGW